MESKVGNKGSKRMNRRQLLKGIAGLGVAALLRPYAPNEVTACGCR